ncbi:MAG: orotidine-5'-phosphate decarboxylase [Patescibacteria group bacterium]
MRAKDQILKRMRSPGTLLCAGLDPDLRKLPVELLEAFGSDEEKILRFLRGVVDATGSHVCAYKAQKAFFDVLPAGHAVLQEIVRYVHDTQPEVPVIVDCKIGDIENTMDAYIENIFGLIQADGVVVNPYMGDDVILPLSKLQDKAIVVLVKTSNVSGGIVQDVTLQDGRPFWQHVLDLVVTRWNSGDNMIPVLSSTAGLAMAKLRPLIPDSMPILLAGVGAQGGQSDCLRDLLNSEGIGVLVNSSRGLLYPTSDASWWSAVETATIKMKDTLNDARRSRE